MSRPARRSLAAVALLLAGCCNGAVQPPVDHNAGVVKTAFGTMPGGQPIDLYTLTNAKGASVSVSTYGAILARVRMPDKAGKIGDVLLGYDSAADYLAHNSPHFGSLCGRVANRVAKGTFTVDGNTYHVPINNGPNSLHGGKVGYDARLWTAQPGGGNGGPSVTLKLTDPDGEQGYPGTVQATVVYTLTDTGILRIQYTATTDKPTPINLTSHGYWNLKDGGASPILDEVAVWHADKYLPVDDVQIPTGVLADVAGTPFDFRTAKPIGRDLAATGGDPAGYDHCMVVDGPAGTLRPAVTVTDPTTGRVLEVATDQPGMQFYTGNFLDGSMTGRGNTAYAIHNAFAVEAQDFPDAVNHPSFPNSVLRPGQTYHQTTEYRFSTTGE